MEYQMKNNIKKDERQGENISEERIDILMEWKSILWYCWMCYHLFIYLFKGAGTRSVNVVSMVICLVYIQVKGIWKEAV